MNEELKRRILMAVIGTIILLLVVIGASYALFNGNFTGDKTQSIKSGCLKVDMIDDGSVSLDNAYPITDEEGMKQTPYSFKIINNCTVDANYMITINVMEGSNLDNISKVKVALLGEKFLAPTIEADLEETYVIDSKIKGVKKAYKLETGDIYSGETKEFNLYTWIDYDVEQISGSIENKIIINSTQKNK